MDTSKPLHKALEALRKRPGLYLGNTQRPFTSLLGFIGGYAAGYSAAQHGFMTPEQFVPDDFHRFVTEYYGHTFPAGGKGWSTFISEHTTSEEDAFELFFRLREAYEKGHAKPA
jgi:hypothetical protein